MKRFVFSIFFLLIILSLLLTVSAQSPTISIGNGDANGDGVVNSKDILTVLSNYNKSLGLPTDQYGDSLINMVDLGVVISSILNPSPSPTTKPTNTPFPTPTGPTPTPGPQAATWYMAGANPQRTSWVSEEVRGNLNVAWYHPIEPYIPYKVQPIFYSGVAYVSTARGLYVFNSSDGSLLWVYPTELPLGNSPTIVSVNGKIVAYAPGYDHKIHAIDTSTHTDLTGYTPYEAQAGFETNPLVVNNIIYAGNRDGNFYALDAVSGALKWKYQVGGPILYSAAMSKDNTTLYFASQDMYAYALNITDGTLKWKSAKFPGQGFFSFWPVVYTNKSTGKEYVIFNGGENYRQSEFWVATSEDSHGETSIFNSYNLSGGRLPRTSPSISGDWAAGTVTMDASILADYFSKYPYRRSDYVLDAGSGQEFTYTYNGKQTYAPFSYSGVTRGGSKYPPIVNGIDGVFYQQTAYTDYNGWISRGAPVGWKFGTQYLSEVANTTFASDEPTAFSSGGNVIYFTLCCDRSAVGFDVRPGQSNGAWTYWNYNMASNSLIPGYQQMYNDGDSSTYNDMNGWQVYVGKNQSKNGIYGKHGMDQSPPIPYQGKLFFLKGNSLIAFSPTGSGVKTPLPLATIVSAPSSSITLTKTTLQQRLETEVQNMITTGHLRPGYSPAAFFDLSGVGSRSSDEEMGEIFDYFQNPADTVSALLIAYPYLSASLQSSVITYLKSNYGPGAPYDFTKIVHIGWGSGAVREWADPPPDWLNFSQSPGQPYRSPLNPSTQTDCGSCGYWHNFPPFNFYAAWKYAQIVGNNDVTTAKNIFNSMSSKIEAPPTDSFLTSKPYFINLYAAGYLGYLQLKQLAGLGADSTVQGYYNHMLTLRVTNFLSVFKDTPYWEPGGQDGTNWIANLQEVLAPARNFMFMTPEIAAYMNQNISAADLQTMMNEYIYVAPYWFVSRFDNSYGEGTLMHLYNASLFQTKAYIQKQPLSELAKYLDVSAFKVGDLFYIQNLVAAIQAP